MAYSSKKAPFKGFINMAVHVLSNRRRSDAMNRLILTILPVCLGGGLLLSAAAGSALNSDDLTFVKNAAEGGKAEVELGRLAADKSSNLEVKAFANRMIRDHAKADQQLSSLAASKGVDLPSGKGLMNDATFLKLKVLSGKAFDKAYVGAMVDDHKKDVAEFEKQSESAQDPDVKKFAAKTLPTLREHLTSIEKLQSDLDSQ
jgi:putative membrane protein